ncbi:hypothetical protein HYX04_03840 [Candidatus Woesearchaeota archaeon]|nr:hypothetical protein [Candidatus Woesearchaeota archaeon]
MVNKTLIQRLSQVVEGMGATDGMEIEEVPPIVERLVVKSEFGLKRKIHKQRKRRDKLIDSIAKRKKPIEKKDYPTSIRDGYQSYFKARQDPVGGELNDHMVVRRAKRTNEILTEFGFPDDSSRNQFLSSFSGESQYGGAVVRTAYRLGIQYGMFKLGVERTPKDQGLLIEIARYIGRYGSERAQALFGLVGAKKFHEFKNYVAVQVGKEVCLVTGGNLNDIVSRLESIQRKTNAPAFIVSQGYSRTEVHGFAVYHR